MAGPLIPATGRTEFEDSLKPEINIPLILGLVDEIHPVAYGFYIKSPG